MSVTIAISENPPVTIPDRATASLASFRAWAGDNDLPEKARLFFHRGEVWVEMGKEQLFTHVEVKSEISTVLRALVRAGKLGRAWVEGVLLTNEAADLSGNPDMVFLSADTLASARVALTEGADGGYVEVVGTPDMVLEVVSDSSVRKDTETLLAAYFDAGIPEYWLVDARGDAVDFRIHRRGARRYTAVKPQPGGWVRSVVFGRSFRLVREAAADGNPEFTLEVK